MGLGSYQFAEPVDIRPDPGRSIENFTNLVDYNKFFLSVLLIKLSISNGFGIDRIDSLKALVMHMKQLFKKALSRDERFCYHARALIIKGELDS